MKKNEAATAKCVPRLESFFAVLLGKRLDIFAHDNGMLNRSYEISKSEKKN